MKEQSTCKCTAYRFPHRVGGGACRVVDVANANHVPVEDILDSMYNDGFDTPEDVLAYWAHEYECMLADQRATYYF